MFVSPLKKIIRIATKDDLEIMHSNEQQAHEAYQIARRKIQEHALDMRLVAVECTFDLNKILFYFTGRMAVSISGSGQGFGFYFRTRIELRRIGVRDEAKMIGGLGICGRELCCSSYLDDFQPVSINMAKEQNLSLNPTKISGTCGRLMCCLKYEHEVYTELQKVTPKTDSLVETPEGRGTVLSTQMLRGTCKVQLEDSPRRAKDLLLHRLSHDSFRTCQKSCGGCQSKPVEIDPMQEQTPAAAAEPPIRPRNEKPRRVKAAPQSSDRTSETPAHTGHSEISERPRLVKAAPKPSEEGIESTEAKKRRRRRNPTKRRPSSGEGEN